MKCPLCDKSLSIESNELYPKYSSYYCTDEESGKRHYIKYFTQDWSFTRYEEQATVGDFCIQNNYNMREGQSDAGIIFQYGLTPRVGYHGVYKRLLHINRIIPIPPADKFMDKIRTLILFS